METLFAAYSLVERGENFLKFIYVMQKVVDGETEQKSFFKTFIHAFFFAFSPTHSSPACRSLSFVHQPDCIKHKFLVAHNLARRSKDD